MCAMRGPAHPSPGRSRRCTHTAVPSSTVSANASDLTWRDDVDLATIEMLVLPSLAVAAAETVFDVDGEVRIFRCGKSVAMDAGVARGRYLGPHAVAGQGRGVVSR